MTKYALMLAAAGFVAFAPAVVKAEDTHAAHSEAEVHAAKEATLKDGTKISIEGDQVYVVAADGTKTAAPDGEHTLSDDTHVTTKDGKVVTK